MKTKSQIQNEIKEANAKIDSLKESVYTNPLVMKKKREYDIALQCAQNKITNEVKTLQTTIIALLEERNNLEKAKKEEIPEKVQIFIKEISRGVDWQLVVKWVSPKQRFVITTNPGGNGWCGRGDTKYYASEHMLFDMSKRGKDESYFAVQKCQVNKKEGRLDKETKQNWIDYALKEEK